MDIFRDVLTFTRYSQGPVNGAVRAALAVATRGAATMMTWNCQYLILARLLLLLTVSQSTISSVRVALDQYTRYHSIGIDSEFLMLIHSNKLWTQNSFQRQLMSSGRQGYIPMPL